MLNHIFRAHLIGEPHAYTATHTPRTPALDELHFAVAESRPAGRAEQAAAARRQEVTSPLKTETSRARKHLRETSRS